MSNRIVGVISTDEPALGAATPQQSTEVIGINQDPCTHCQSNHLFRRIGVKEFVLNV